MEDHKQNIWISCFSKKISYLYKRNIYTKDDDEILKNIIIQYGNCNFYRDIDSSVWISKTLNEVYKLHDRKLSSFNFPSSIVQVHRVGQNLIGLGNGYIFDILGENNQTELFDIVKELNKVPIYSGVCVSGNKILYSFFEGLLLFELENNKIRLVDKLKKPIGRVFTDRQNRFWICSPSIGAICFDNDKRDLSNPRVYLAGKKAIYMFEDHQGTYWFCTMDEGVYALPKEPPMNYGKEDGLPSNNTISVSRDLNGDILCGDDEGNLNVINGRGIRTVKYGSVDGYNRILNVVPDRRNNGKWIVSDEGLYYEKGKRRTKVNVQSTTPKAILPQGEGLWCGTSSALYYVSGSAHHTADVKLVKRITALGQDTDGHVWAGSIEGLYCSADSFQKNWSDLFPILHSRLVAIQGGLPGEIWVVTPENGLLKCTVRNGAITTVQEVNRMLKKPVYHIQSLFRADDGRLWLSTNHGIYAIDPHTWETTHFSQYDGLPNNDVRSVLVHRDTLWAGTATGVTRLLLNRSPVTGDFPTYITAVQFQQEKTVQKIQIQDSIPPEQEVMLPPNASLVEIEFTGLDYRSRGNLMYECLITEILLPFTWWTTDNLSTWVLSKFQGKTDTTFENRANLNFGITWKPGRYNIQVTALSGGKVRSLFPDDHTFIMRPQWYATFWAHLIVWGLIGSGLYRIYQTRVQLDKMATAVARSRLFALQAQINPHFVGNAINAVQRYFYPPAPEKASIYTATLTQLLRQTLLFSEKTFIRFHEEIEFDKNYLDLTRSRLGLEKFNYTFTGVEEIHEDMPFPALFLQPILENATIHGFARNGSSLIVVAFREHKGRLFCTVTDNGPGLQTQRPNKPGGMGESRQSRGIKMLRNKAATLNQLYDLDLKMILQNNPNGPGTRVIVSYKTDQAIKAQNRQAAMDLKEPSL